jgi:hypothetical protein
VNILDRNPDGSYRIHIRDGGVILAEGRLPDFDTGIATLQQLIHRIQAAELHAANEKARR